MTSRLPTNKELGIKPTKKDHALADEIVLSGRMKVPATWQSSLEPFTENPDLLVVKDGDDSRTLRFVERNGGQKCSDCWFEWFDTHLCQKAPCNSQDRSDDRVGTWQEPTRAAR